jgi:hypothetical protein
MLVSWSSTTSARRPCSTVIDRAQHEAAAPAARLNVNQEDEPWSACPDLLQLTTSP